MFRQASSFCIVLLACAMAPMPAVAGCALKTSATDLITQLETAETAYSNLEVEQFMAAVELAAMDLPCITEPVSPQLAGRVHRIQAIRMYGAGDEHKASEALRSARRADAEASLSEDLLPAGHPMHELFAKAGTVELTQTRVPEPLTGSLLIDGVPSLFRPDDQAVIVQVLDVDGAPVDTRYLFTDAEWLAYEAHALPEPLPLEAPSSNGKSILLGVSGGAVLGGVGALAGAAAIAGSWGRHTQELDITAERAGELVRTNHALVVVGSGLTAVGVGIGAVGLLGSF